jgi:hypothetical protein
MEHGLLKKPRYIVYHGIWYTARMLVNEKILMMVMSLSPSNPDSNSIVFLQTSLLQYARATLAYSFTSQK